MKIIKCKIDTLNVLELTICITEGRKKMFVLQRGQEVKDAAELRIPWQRCGFVVNIHVCEFPGFVIMVFDSVC